jgi:hypothetical protein
MAAARLTDRWLSWLTGGRDAGSTALRRRSLELLLPIRDATAALVADCE